MTIYIYGSDSFKNEINDVLRHSNIKFRLDDRGEIKELNTLNELKNAIEENPNNIYLIDDSKIIKKSILTDKIKFLKPKDGIEQEYLLDHGIGDVSVDSIEELSKHIIRRLDSVLGKEENIEDIQDSIIEIVEGAYEEDSNSNASEDLKIEQVYEINAEPEEFSSDEIEEHIELDDELSALLASSKDDDPFFEEEGPQISDEEALADILNQVEEIEIAEKQDKENQLKEENENFNPSSNLDDLLVQLEESHQGQILTSDEKTIDNDDLSDLQDVLDQIEESEITVDNKIEENEVDPLKDLSFDDNLDNIINDEKSIDEDFNISTQGEKMSDQFSEFDTLSENEILAALDGVENLTITKESEEKKENSVVASNNSNNLSVDSANADEIAKLITQLLNNKTLEITIKVKD
ncbi:hypothetical protein [Halarcobacter bivalviorum]|uniref:Highly acidic protein n=1 Tax=Halarcobacter bivalviorum TaxID=663364 RepID=A0AAX2A863_9BACT|nr:hypothetical protein [Halarcobacter bivalviorum]AXH13356.1 hypothetical protein ABIV_2382 [Halarcobacter bivalviorum]RXK10040.1 hypothetical protein CRV05_06590 [Halarcobacter bivalviorum]